MIGVKTGRIAMRMMPVEPALGLTLIVEVRAIFPIHGLGIRRNGCESKHKEHQRAHEYQTQ